MSTQTAYFNLVTKIYTETTPGAKTQLSAFQTQLANLTNASTMAGKAVATAAGFITYQLISTALMGVVNFVKGSVDAFVDFEYAMAGVQRTVADFLDFEPELNAFASTMSQELGISAVEVAEAMQFMGSVGKTSSEIMRDFNDIAKMAVALQIDLEDAIQTVVRAQQVWNKEGYTATQISDILNQMTNKTALNMEFLAGALRMGGPAAAATNTSLEEMSAILVELAETGFKGTMAGRSLNTIFVKMQTESGALLKHLKELKTQGFDVNIKAMEGFAGASMVEKYEKLAAATANLSDQQKIQVAQMIAGTNFLKQQLILTENAADLQDNLAKATGSAGSTLEEFNVVMDTTEMLTRQTDQEVEALQRNIGENLAPALASARKEFWGFIDALVDFNQRHPSSVSSMRQGMVANWEMAEALKAINAAVKAGAIDWEERTELIVGLNDGTVDAIKVTEAMTKAIKEAEVGEQSFAQALHERGLGLRIATQDMVQAQLEASEYYKELMAVSDAVEEMERVLSYLSGEMTEAAFNERELTWATAEAKAMFLELSSQLNILNADLMETAGLMDDNADAMWDVNHSTAELRYEQLLLDKALRDGDITQKNYEKQSKALDNQLFELRVTSAGLALDQMELTKQFNEEKGAVDEVTGKIDLLTEADDALEGAISSLEAVVINLAEVLADLDTTLEFLSGEMIYTGSVGEEMGDDLLAAFGLAGASMETLEGIASMSLWEIQKEFGITADEAQYMRDGVNAYLISMGNTIDGVANGAVSDLQRIINQVNALETETGKSVAEMVRDWETYASDLKKIFKNSYDDIDRYLDDPPGAGGGGGGDTGGTSTSKEWQKVGSYLVNGKAVSDETGWYDSKAEASAAWSALQRANKDSGTSSTSQFKSRGAAMGYEGWVTQPTMMMVGEKGAEYVSVRNQNQQPGQGTGGGMGSVTINLPNVTSVEDPAQVKRIFRSVMLQLSGER